MNVLYESDKQGSGAFLWNAWYCAGWSEDVADEQLGITLLGQQIVLFRDSDRRVAALGGRCPHRFAPLDRGTVIGDVIACPYHGLRFATDGTCVLNPNGDGFIPSGARLPVYPVRERNGALWVWMGDPSKAADDRLPDDQFLVESGWAVRRSYLKIRANYQLVTDNLLDLTHAQYIHASTLGAFSPAARENTRVEHSFKADDGIVYSEYRIADVSPSALMQPLFPYPRGDRTSSMRWSPASNLRLDSMMDPIGQAGNGHLHLPSVHYLSPETEYTTHYFVAIGRNQKLDDHKEDERMIGLVMRAFIEEDEPILEACQALMKATDIFSLNPVILKTDVAAVRARRMLAKLIQGENAAWPMSPCRGHTGE